MTFSLINFIFIGVFLGGTFYFWWRTHRMRAGFEWTGSDEIEAGYTLLSISVPKNNDRTPLAAEQMFAALHGIFREGAATQQQLSFEIVSKARVITFYVFVPTDLKTFVSSQIFAQYPNVEINEVEDDNDYVQLAEDRALAATELAFKKPAPMPIKTFVNFEVDPLSAITGVLSSASEHEEIWIQMIIRPLDDEWQKQGEKIIKDIKEPPPKTVGVVSLIWNEVKALGKEAIKGVIIGPSTEEAKKEEKKKDDLPGTVQQAIKGVEEKITKLRYESNIRILAGAPDEHVARAKLEQVVGAFKQFNTLNMNSLTFKEITNDREAWMLFKKRSFGEGEMIFNITEIASLYHFPSETVSTPTIAWAGSKKGEPPANLPLEGTVPADELTVFGQTNFRNEVKKFGIKKKDRRLHMYIIGKTGTGKSTLMENMIIDDINEGRGMAVVDPHGTLIQHVLDFIPESRVQDVIYFNPADREHPVGFNLLENVDPEQKNIVASGVVGIMEKIFVEVSWGPRLEYIVRNVILALLEYPNSTFMGIMRILTDNAYRRMVLNEVKDPVIRDFFINEYEKYEPKFRTEAIAPIQNKVGQFLSASTIRNIVGQPKSTIDIRQIMDEGKILLCDLSIGKIGEDNSALLGSMLITKIQLAAMGRVNIAEDQRRDFYLYVDEFQNFATESFATILSEARKYRLNLAMANQYTAQMPESVSNAVFGNVGTMISFRVGAQDADMLVKEYEPIFDANDLVNLDNFQIYLKMAIDGVTVPAFSAGTLPPKVEKTNLVDRIVESSRRLYTRPVEEVEDYITEWSTPINLSDPSKQTLPQPYTEIKIKSDAFNQIPNPKSQILSPEQSMKEGSAESQKPEVGSGMPEVKGSEQQNQEEAPKMMLPQGMKVEILKDRFDRPWYAVVAPIEQEENIDDKGTPSNGRGGAGDENNLITWEQAEVLGVEPDQLEPNLAKSEPAVDDWQPLDEIR